MCDVEEAHLKEMGTATKETVAWTWCPDMDATRPTFTDWLGKNVYYKYLIPYEEKQKLT